MRRVQIFNKQLNKFFSDYKLKWISDIFYFNRSITGSGTLKHSNTLKNINQNFVIKNFKSGEKVYD